jgi:hypothetical protein
LSSQVLISLISQSTQADSSILSDILTRNGPLPGDVLQLIVNGTAPLAPAHLEGLLRANPVGIAVTSTGLAYIDVDSPAAANLLVNGGIQKLIVRGQEDSPSVTGAENLPPLIFAICESGATALQNILFEGRNARPLILAMKKEGDRTEAALEFSATPGFPSWRTLFELQGVGIVFDASKVGGATLVGGIRTDQTVDCKAGSLTIQRDFNPAPLALYASRNAWLEIISLP